MINNFEIALARISEANNRRSVSLDLSSLNLRNLPDSITELNFLIELDLSNNYFNILPPIINELPNLRYFYLKNNCLTYYNNLGFHFPCYLPLIFIDLSNNNISRVPEDLFYLEYIEEIILDGNPVINGVPDYILSEGIESIEGYHSAMIESSQYDILFETKLIFVGQGEVGKTSLMKKLFYENYNLQIGEESSTHGINIAPFNVKIEFNIEELHDLEYSYINYDYEGYEISTPGFEYDLENEDLVYKYAKFNVWDFGGQEIYYSTHQFFLTKRSIYVFVWDARREEDYRRFEYWFNIISILSESSPIIIVMNKLDERTRHIEYNSLKNRFSNIIDFYSVSALTGDNILELKSGIIDVFKNLPHLGDKLPKVWLTIRDQISKLNKPYINFDEYREVCRLNGVPNNRVSQLIDYLHDLGDVLYYKKDPTLKNLIILSPEWATSAFYKLVDDSFIQKSNGKFSLYNLQQVWDSTNYPESKHLEIIRLIERFELCFNIVGSFDYIIPELLLTEPDFNYTSLINQSQIKIEYRFNFMPAGIIPRFICRSFASIDRLGYWKNGVVIRFDESIALILGDHLERKINVYIHGYDRSALLGIIRNDLVSIFSSLKLSKDKEYYEMVPCCCEECVNSKSPHYFKHTVLKRFAQKNKQFVTCDISTDDVEISKLLKGYDGNRVGDRILDFLIIACAQLQGNSKILHQNEDSRNSFIANVLTNRGLIAKDQSRWGVSPTDKSQGELDIRIESNDGLPISIFEGMNLKNLDTSKIHSHLEKIFTYDSNGLKNNYLVIYSEAKNFSMLWENYQKAILSASPKFQIIGDFYDLSSNYSFGARFKIGKTSYNVSDSVTNVYHLFVDLS